jgi:hypothetical protein
LLSKLGQIIQVNETAGIQFQFLKIKLLVMFMNQINCLFKCRQLSLFSLCVLVSLVSYSQQKYTASGIISNEKSEPLEGVSVRVKGSTSGTTTDKQGKFKLSTNDENTVIVASLSGFKTQEIPAINGESLKIVLSSIY